jgi:hypothetical protein
LSEPSDAIDLPGQLQALIRQLTASNPELYRHVALYLQVLRQVEALRCFRVNLQPGEHRCVRPTAASSLRDCAV